MYLVGTCRGRVASVKLYIKTFTKKNGYRVNFKGTSYPHNAVFFAYVKINIYILNFNLRRERILQLNHNQITMYTRFNKNTMKKHIINILFQNAKQIPVHTLNYKRFVPMYLWAFINMHGLVMFHVNTKMRSVIYSFDH